MTPNSGDIPDLDTWNQIEDCMYVCVSPNKREGETTTRWRTLMELLREGLWVVLPLQVKNTEVSCRFLWVNFPNSVTQGELVNSKDLWDGIKLVWNSCFQSSGIGESSRLNASLSLCISESVAMDCMALHSEQQIFHRWHTSAEEWHCGLLCSWKWQESCGRPYR